MSLTGALPPSSLPSTSACGPTGRTPPSRWQHLGVHGRACGGGHRAGPGRGGRVDLRVDAASRLKKQLRMANSPSARGADSVRAPFGHRWARTTPCGPPPHARVRHHIEQLAEVAVSTRYNAGSIPTPSTGTHHDRRRRRRTHGLDPLSKLHCCIRTMAVVPWCSRTKSGPGIAPSTRLGPRHRGSDLAHDHE